MSSRRRTWATALALTALVAATALVGYDLFLAARSTGMADLAVITAHLLFGWVPAVIALIGLLVRRSRLTIVALVVAAAALVVPPVVAAL